MYCPKCAKPIVEGELRCASCGHSTQSGQLKFYCALSWLGTLAMLYAGASVFQVVLTFWAGSGLDLPPYMRAQASFSYYVYLLSLPAVVVVAPAIWFIVNRYHLLRFLNTSVYLDVLAGILFTGSLVLLANSVQKLHFVAVKFNDRLERDYGKMSELSALESIRRLQSAQVRYRLAHPGIGFTCDPEALKGFLRRKETAASAATDSFWRDTLDEALLTGCAGAPNSKYQVEVPGTGGFGGLGSFFCSDESGEIYFVGKAIRGECLAKRVPLY